MFNAIAPIYKKELRSFFYSPVAYIVMSMFLLLAGWFFYAVLHETKAASLELTLSNLVIVLIFLMPLLSMRLLSEEKKSGTLEILLTRPVREIDIVVGKYLAAITTFFIMLIPTLIYAAILFRFSQPDIFPLITQYLSVFLVGCSFLALGLFASSLTENQIIAAAIGFAIILVLWLLDWITGSLGPNNILSYFAISSHFNDLNKGVVDARDIVFYLSFICFWIYLTVRILDARRWI